MHEWLITRGDVRGAPFEIQIQIFVPVNAVICHEGVCHQRLQFGEKGLIKCLNHILQFHTPGEISDWLQCIKPYLSIVQEKERQLSGLLDGFVYSGSGYSGPIGR